MRGDAQVSTSTRQRDLEQLLANVDKKTGLSLSFNGKYVYIHQISFLETLGSVGLETPRCRKRGRHSPTFWARHACIDT